uniref:CNH domain-containing protein n=1 Tax=Kalanchoe fedtschenkoi TaxID=63787 RepID=A0A7N0VGU3_KALFE
MAIGSNVRTVVESFTHFHLPDSLTSPIRSIAARALSHTQTLIYTGTTSGTLILHSIDQTATPADAKTPPKASFLASVLVSKSPVDSIHVIADAGELLLLSDGSFFLADPWLRNPVRRLAFPKRVNAVSKRVKSGEPCSNLSDEAEHSTTSQRFFQKLGTGARANGFKSRNVDGDGNHVFVAVAGNKLILFELVFGDRLGQTSHHLDSASGAVVVLKEILCVDGISTVVWIDDYIIVGSSTGYASISCVTGQNSLIFSLPDPSSRPLLKLLQKDYKVLLLVDNVGIVVHPNGNPVGGSLIFHGIPDSVGELSSYLVVLRDGRMELYKSKSGSLVQTTYIGAEGAGRCILTNEEVGDHKLLFVATSSKVICYRKVPSDEQIKDLLRKKNFSEAVCLVEELEMEGEMTKEMLSSVHAQVGFLLLFDLHFEEAIDHFLKSETMHPSEVFPFIMRDPNRWSLLVPRNRYWGLHRPPAPLEDVVDDGIAAIQRATFLKKAGVETAIDEKFITTPPNRSDLLEDGIKNFIRYLEVARTKELSSSEREGVDTLLMFLYRSLNRVDDMEKLASSENYCVVEELEILLEESGHLRSLAFLYASKGISAKALSIWRTLARNYVSGLWKDPSKEICLNGDNGSHVMTGKETAAYEASKILEESSDQDLILQHLGWIADISQVLAIKVLTSGRRADQPSPYEVIAAIDPKKVDILQSYLRWLIEDQNSDDTRIHTLYAISLAKSATENYQLDGSVTNLSESKVDEKNVLDSESIFLSSARERLQIFLQSSYLYDPIEVLDVIEASDLWLEKAILYRKLGQETLVLQILALKLEDSEAAEQYCAEIGRPDAYMQLLDMYLSPQEGRQPMFKAAVRLLHNHGELLDPLQVLETLSPDMPLQLASDTILRMLRARVHHHRQGQIVCNLSRAVDVDARLSRLEERSRHVQINDESLCESCRARLGTKLFAMYPDDTIICYKCFRRQGESTSITGRDFKQDPLIKPGWLVTR